MAYARSPGPYHLARWNNWSLGPTTLTGSSTVWPNAAAAQARRKVVERATSDADTPAPMANRRAKSKEQRPRLRRRTKRRLAWAAVAVATILVGLGVYQWSARRPGQWVRSLGNEHLAAADEKHVPYNSNPPSSGPHLPYIAPWGIHTEPIVNELQVHNLEEGGVLIQYNCPQGCPDLVASLKTIVLRYDRQVILAPYPGMDRRIALTAWTRIDKFDELDEKRIVRFIEAYRGIDHHPRSFF